MAGDKLLQEFRQAKNKDEFLKNHPNFAKSHPELSSIPGTGGKKVQKTVAGDIAAGQAQGIANIQLQNPAYQTPFGSSQVTFDAQGNPVYTETMDPAQKALLEGDQALHTQGTAAASDVIGGYTQFQGGSAGQVPQYQNQAGQVPQYQNQAGQIQPVDPSVQNLNQFQGGQGAAQTSQDLIGGYQGFGFGGAQDERAKVEEAVYGRLTKNVDRDEQRRVDAKKQELFNKGIPYSNDPESRYQKELGTIREEFSGIRSDAISRAVEMGGAEMSRSFDIEAGTHGIKMSDMGQMFNLAQQTHVTKEQTDQAQFMLEKLTSDQRAALQQQAHSQGITDTEMLAKLQAVAHGQGVTDTQLLANLQQQQFGQDLTTHTQGLQDAAMLSGIGTGAIMPNLPGFQAPPAAEITIPSEYKLALKKLGLTDKEIQTQWKIAQLNADVKKEDIAAKQAMNAANIEANEEDESDGDMT